jgi:uncharacterized protein YutE (UPF0331/DUF86 family)
MTQEYVTVERYKKLVDFVNELVQNYNKLEQRIAALENHGRDFDEPVLTSKTG